MVAALTSIDELFALLRGGAEPLVVSASSDEVGELAHNLQCADRLREDFPDDLELLVAGLVHDVASSSALRPRPPGDHGLNGAAMVRPLLGDRIADLVRLHVAAKRYLVSTDPAYRGILSPNSVHTLVAQGDAMNAVELSEFVREAHGRAAVDLRRADDRAKVPGALSSSLEEWRPIVEAIAACRAGLSDPLAASTRAVVPAQQHVHRTGSRHRDE